MNKIRKLVIALFALLILGFVAVTGGYWVYSRATPSDYAFTSGFEMGDLSEWDMLGAQQLCCAHSAVVQTEHAATGKYAARFELNADDPSVRGSKRSEMRLSSPPFGVPTVFRIRIYLPNDWAPARNHVTLLQWHNVPDMYLLEGGSMPPLRLAVLDDRLLVISNWNRARVSHFRWQDAVSEGFEVLTDLPVETGRWMEWEFHVTWSIGDDGVVQVFKDGELVGERYGPNAFNDPVPPYFKMGLYVPEWSDNKIIDTHRVAYFDDVAQLSGVEALR